MAALIAEVTCHPRVEDLEPDNPFFDDGVCRRDDWRDEWGSNR